jgi:uncharacterized membrane protein YdjX (TVP38/TMEM64 family)
MLNDKYNKLGTILSIGFIIAVIYFLIKDIGNIQIIILRSGIWAPIVAIILYTTLSPTPISTDPLTIIVGTIYGPLVGSLIAWIGNILAGLVEYYMGTRINQITNFSKSKKNLPFGLGKLPIDSPAFLILGRLIPIYGGKIISILAGVYRVPIKLYLWTTIVTTFLGSALLALGGFHLINLLVK